MHGQVILFIMRTPGGRRPVAFIHCFQQYLHHRDCMRPECLGKTRLWGAGRPPRPQTGRQCATCCAHEAGCAPRWPAAMVGIPQRLTCSSTTLPAMGSNVQLTVTSMFNPPARSKQNCRTCRTCRPLPPGAEQGPRPNPSGAGFCNASTWVILGCNRAIFRGRQEQAGATLIDNRQKCESHTRL